MIKEKLKVGMKVRHSYYHSDCGVIKRLDVEQYDDTVWISGPGMNSYCANDCGKEKGWCPFSIYVIQSDWELVPQSNKTMKGVIKKKKGVNKTKKGVRK